jgi:cysteine synthase B
MLPQRRLRDASSGNTAIAYAMLGAAGGIGVTVCVPANASVERQVLLRTYGADVELTDPLEGTDGAIRRARALAAEQPERYWYADQYGHPANPRAHYLTTAEEIWRQTEGRITHLVAGLGTTGTLMGAGRRLKELNRAITLVAVQPDGPFHGLEGLKHMDTAIVPAIYDAAVPDRTEFIATE